MCVCVCVCLCVCVCVCVSVKGDICEDTLNLDSKEYHPVSAVHRTFETAHLTAARAYPLCSFAYFSEALMDEDG